MTELERELLKTLRKIRSLLSEIEARDSEYEQCFTEIWKQCRDAIRKAQEPLPTGGHGGKIGSRDA